MEKTKMTIRIIQTNLGRGRAAHDLAYATAKQKKVDIIIVSEPNKKIVQSNEWVKDIRVDVAVLFVNRKLNVSNIKVKEGYIVINFVEWDLYCCYISPNIPINEYVEKVDEIANCVKCRKKEAIIAGDINAKSHMWGSPVTDGRGEYWSEWIAALDMVVLNTGEVPTFVRGNTESFIDATISTQKFAKHITGWQVLDEETLTEHRYISYGITVNKPSERPTEKRKYVTDWDAFNANLELRLANTTKTEKCSYKMCINIIKEAYINSTKEGPRGEKRVPYWWSVEIEAERKECKSMRREYTRMSKKRDKEEEKLLAKKRYNESKKDLRKLIMQSKREHWKKLCNELNNDIWGEGYRLAMKGIKHLVPYEIPAREKKEIVKQLFPQSANATENYRKIVASVPKFTETELHTATQSMKTGKAPGMDGIPAEAVKEVVKSNGQWLLKVLNELLKIQKFPREWKIAKAILLPKDSKPGQLKSYRPLCLLNTLSKLYESMIRQRLEEEIEQKGNFAKHQYGFRKGRSTLQAMEIIRDLSEKSKKEWNVLITLDVRNAFNTASWNLILKNLENRKISQYLINVVGDYLNERFVQVTKKDRLKVEVGVPQGSVLGPTLWNVLYDDVLKIKLQGRSKTIAFADDLALLVTADSKRNLMINTDANLNRIAKWMEENALQLAPEKTEALIITHKRKRDGLFFKLNNVTITPKKTVKYLGVFFDTKGSFREHLEQVTGKAENRMGRLTRLLPNIGGPCSSKRAILAGMIHSIILYGAPIWADALSIKRNRLLVEKTQRKALIRVVAGYKTISTLALQVVAGIPPIDLQAQERKYMYQQGKNGNIKDARRRTMILWQERWSNNFLKAQWTKQLIPDLTKWMECEHRRTDYYLTQALTGHGVFGTYVYRIGKAKGDECAYCGDPDTAAHTIFSCKRWKQLRERAGNKLGKEITANNLVDSMIESRQNWEELHQMIRQIMKIKEAEERVRQKTDN